MSQINFLKATLKSNAYAASYSIADIKKEVTILVALQRNILKVQPIYKKIAIII